MYNEVSFSMLLAEGGEHSVGFSSTGRTRQASFLGWIWNTRTKLDDERVSLHINEGEFAGAVREQDSAPLPETSAIGVVRVAPRVQPIKDLPYEKTPISAAILLSAGNYEAAVGIIRSTLDRQQYVVLTLQVRSDQLIPGDRVRLARFPDADFTNGFEGRVFRLDIRPGRPGPSPSMISLFGFRQISTKVRPQVSKSN